MNPCMIGMNECLIYIIWEPAILTSGDTTGVHCQNYWALYALCCYCASMHIDVNGLMTSDSLHVKWTSEKLTKTDVRWYGALVWENLAPNLGKRLRPQRFKETRWSPQKYRENQWSFFSIFDVVWRFSCVCITCIIVEVVLPMKDSLFNGGSAHVLHYQH